MFNVKATVVDILGDQEKYPCHACLKIGDEVIFDGEKYTGRLCVDLWPEVTKKAAALHAAGPRYIEPVNYFPFKYVCVSQVDPNKKIYDGRGFRNIFEGYDEPRYHMAHLGGASKAFKWPPPTENVITPLRVTCPDTRTAVVVELEVFDVSAGGFSLPFFRRQMVILDRVFKKQGIQMDKILNEFTKEEQLEIYPPLSLMEIMALVEELEIVGHMELKDGKAYVTKKGEAKVAEFKKGLEPEEKKALKV